MLLRFSPSVAGGLMQACVRETASRVGEKIAILGFPLGGSLFLSRGEVSRIEAAEDRDDRNDRRREQQDRPFSTTKAR